MASVATDPDLPVRRKARRALIEYRERRRTMRLTQVPAVLAPLLDDAKAAGLSIEEVRALLFRGQS